MDRNLNYLGSYSPQLAARSLLELLKKILTELRELADEQSDNQIEND